MARVNLTIDMEDYIEHMRRAGVRLQFDEWIKQEGITDMLCFRIDFLAGESATMNLHCYIEPLHTRASCITQFTPATPPPPEVMRWLLTR